MSTDRVQAYNPDARAYGTSIEALSLPREEICFVAFAGWDASGAKAFGHPVYWANRAGAAVEELGNRPDYIAQDLTRLAATVQALAARIARDGGAALIVDYGYGADAGYGETLQAIRARVFAPVLESPGEADLTAHVDFAALARAAREAGAAAFGPEPQGAFLERLGIGARAARLGQQAARARLTETSQMGGLFKALAILPDGAPPPEGF